MQGGVFVVDEHGNIVRSLDLMADREYTYTYEDGELINTMTYDNYGNIVSKNDTQYSYGNTTWKDLLTSYNGQAITYDAQGNPTSYLGHTLAWEKGRQLKSFDDIQYTYNANGIRTSKTIDGIRHNYVLDGAKIILEHWQEGNFAYQLVPLYDNEESVCGISYNNTAYYFLKNLQGDVIAITDDSGNTVAKYSYDAWGVCTVEPGSADIANINPYRYRGYYYDAEIGMYYLQSRYYDPVIGRFLNVDVVSYLIPNRDPTLCNLFTYCGNSPINDSDKTGNLATRIVSMILGAFLTAFFDIIGQAIVHFIINKNKFKGFKINWWSFGIAFLSGVISGALMTSNLKRLMQTIVGGVLGLITGLIQCLATRKPIKPLNIFVDFIFGALAGFIGGKGVGATFFKKHIFTKGGSYIIGGKVFTYLPLKNKAVLKEFASAFGKLVVGNIIALFKKAIPGCV